jgi:hypothetical protein
MKPPIMYSTTQHLNGYSTKLYWLFHPSLGVAVLVGSEAMP